MSNLMKHAVRELASAGYGVDCGKMNQMMRENVLELIGVFSRQGHSGMSAPFCIGIFKTLASFAPFGPLTGQDDEWMEVGTGVFQNIRCSHVFKGADGQAYDIDGRIFRYQDGSCCTNHDSRVNVTFPYTPKREYVDVLDRSESGVES